MIKIFPTSLVRELDAYTIENEPISSLDLMERAAEAIVHSLVSQWNNTTPVVVFAGPGNNGGDALAVARMLHEAGYHVETFLFNPKKDLSPDCKANKERLEALPNVNFTEVGTQFLPPKLTFSHLVVDGLFGSGLNRPLEGGFAAVIRYINASPAIVVAIDMPSGLMGEDNSENNPEAIIKADYTFCLQFPKLSFLFAENAVYVGEWYALDIGISREAIADTETDFYLTEAEDIRCLIKSRSPFAHKGNFGHALLIAGSQGMAGASILASRACLRSGVGLLTTHVPKCNREILQTAVVEAMVDTDPHPSCFSTSVNTDKYQAVGIGPGLGQSAESEDALLETVSSCRHPMVLDADALNMLSKHKPTLFSIPVGSVLTPHPKELERMVGECSDSYERLAVACALAQRGNLHLILKGRFSAVVSPEGECYFNPTGNVGMATAGSGDVLTGIVLALLAQGYAAGDAARIAAYVHGRAGDLAKEKYGIIALNASDIVEFLAEAWKEIAE
jgi:NAD(P)H-hydrate epimerase